MKDVSGQKFGRLTAVRFSGWKNFKCGKRQPVWEFMCDCGQKKEALLWNVKRLHTKSCGCVFKETRGIAQLAHGDSRKDSKHPLYIVWCGMKQRCYDQNCKLYPRWGGRGIRVLWKSYEDFKRDMEPSFVPGLQIERIDNSGNYCKENCKWATAREQALNRRSNLILTYNGQSKPCRVWADQIGMKYETLRMRIHSGWSTESALTTPVLRYRAQA